MAINFSSRHWVLTILGVLFTVYVVFQARFIIFGPQVIIETPRDGEVVTSSMITVSGQAKNAAWLSLNDSQIFTDEKGAWNEKLIVSEGTSIMTVRVRDRFGREKETSITITFN